MEDQPPCRSQRFKNIPPLFTIDPPPPPKRQRLDTHGSFESTRFNQSPREPKLQCTQTDHLSMEIEDLQAQEFATNYNPPITNLSGPVLLQVHSFGSLGVGVPLCTIMSSSG